MKKFARIVEKMKNEWKNKKKTINSSREGRRMNADDEEPGIPIKMGVD